MQNADFSNWNWGNYNLVIPQAVSTEYSDRFVLFFSVLSETGFAHIVPVSNENENERKEHPRMRRFRLKILFRF